MRGTDVTPGQLAHAEYFLRMHASTNYEECRQAGGMLVELPDLIRLLAWYGAIRAKSGRIEPNPLVEVLAPEGGK